MILECSAPAKLVLVAPAEERNSLQIRSLRHRGRLGRANI